MDENMAYCGTLCDQCWAYKATMTDDMDLRDRTAAQWSKAYGVEIKPEDINCKGCRSDMLFTRCNFCEIRACAIAKGHEHCGKCDSFVCAKVDEILKYDAGAIERLTRGKK